MDSSAAGAPLKNGRWTATEYAKQAEAPIVWAKRGKASSQYDTWRYGAEKATGAPAVFPNYGDKSNAWAPRLKRSDSDWLEVTFPKTRATQVRIFETGSAGAIRRVTDISSGETVLYETNEAPGTFQEAQVLWIDLAGPREMTGIRIEVNAGLVKDWPQIDAVGLVGEKLATGREGLEGRWGASDYLQRKAEEKLVWATGAAASSQFDNHRFAAKFATGEPDVFPKFGDSKNTWQLKSKRGDQWIELDFPKTLTHQVRIFETCAPGAVSRVVDLTDGEHVLYQAEDPLGDVTEAQVLWVSLKQPRAIKKLRIQIDPKLASGWPQIDAVCLVP